MAFRAPTDLDPGAWAERARSREERERRSHLRRWTLLTIVHPAGRDESMPYCTLEKALRRLREPTERVVPRRSDVAGPRTA